MRNLIITREKTFVASLMKLKVYIEDPVYGDLNINGKMCRKLGNIGNGEQLAFPIDENAARIYVIADKLSKNYCNEFFDIPAGSFDVAVKGKNHYNPFAGNPFRFDGNVSEEVLNNRKKNNRKFIVVLIIAGIIGFFIGLIPNLLEDAIPAKAQVFSKDSFSIILTDDFSEENFEGFEVCYVTNDVAVLVTKEEISFFENFEINSLEDYAELIIDNNSIESEVEFINTLICFEYTAEGEDTYKYFATVFESDTDYWLVQFSADEKDYDQYYQNFIEWAESIEID